MGQLTSLDLSTNTFLLSLSCSYNQLLLYIYNDGAVEKKIIIE